MQSVNNSWRTRLTNAGFREEAVERAADGFERVQVVFAERCGDPRKAFAWWVPGRIEVLGKHTDYGGGRSLICPVERGLHLLATPRTDGVVRIIDASSGTMWTGSIRDDLQPAPGEWFDYPITVTRRVARDFPGSRTGMDLVFLSSIPRAAGLSSSSAVVVASFLPLAEFNQLESHPVWAAQMPDTFALAGYLGAVENGLAFGDFKEDFGVGTHGGSEDHTAILCGKSNQLSTFHYLPVTFEASVPLPDRLTFVVASSGVPAAKAGAVKQSYNALSEQIQRLLWIWRRNTGSTAASLFDALNEHTDVAVRLHRLLESEIDVAGLSDRLTQFREECEVIIPGVVLGLATDDIVSIGTLVDRSQLMAENILRNQVPETVHLTRQARRMGAVASSAFGGGFGGSVWALVADVDAGTFCTAWSEDYRKHFRDRASRSDFFTTRPGPGATRI